MKAKKWKKGFVKIALCLMLLFLLSACSDTEQNDFDNVSESESEEISSIEDLGSSMAEDALMESTVELSEEITFSEEESSAEESSMEELPTIQEKDVEVPIEEQIIEEPAKQVVEAEEADSITELPPAEQSVEAPTSEKTVTQEQVIVEPPVEEQMPVATPVTDAMVWKSETGSKYHSINNCGRMNPDKATQITKPEAEAMGLGACSKCW